MKEKIVLVDKHDNIIWHKYRDEVEHRKDIYRVSVLWIENNKNEVLLAQRAFTKKSNPWVRWPAVAGTNAQGESYLDNILKESEEEIWRKLSENNLIKWPHELVTYKTKGRKYFRQRFIAKTDKPLESFTIQEEEVEKIMRISKPELLNMLKHHPEKFTSNAPEYIPMMIKFTENN